jgi:hypothetical protein
VTKRDDRTFSIGLLLVLVGVACTAGGTLIAYHLQTLKIWWADLTRLAANVVATPEAYLDAQVSALGVFLGIGGLMLVVAGLAILRRSAASRSSTRTWQTAPRGVEDARSRPRTNAGNA